MASRIFILVMIAVLAGCANFPAGNRQIVSKETADLTKLKSESEQWAKRIKDDYLKGSLQYETSYNKYISAKSAVDSWVDRLCTGLTNRNDISSSKEYQAAVQEASEKGENFIEYARGLYEKSLTATSPIVVLFPLLSTAGLQIWDKYNAASKQDIDDVNKSLQSLKWKSFTDI